jgi:uncharacterized membrane protein YdjX (TVP38/TMEM64 family)
MYFRPFILATSFGVIPHVFVLTNAVVEVGESAAHGFHLTPGIMVAFALVAVVAITPVLVQKYLKSRSR